MAPNPSRWARRFRHLPPWTNKARTANLRRMGLSRSQVMSRIRGRDTEPERIVRSLLWRRGLRYRLHAKTPVGRPDLVFKGARVAVWDIDLERGATVKVLSGKPELTWITAAPPTRRSEEWPPMANSVTEPSIPPATITSATPRRMISAASPIALADAAQAVTVHVLGPARWNPIETAPAA